VPQFAIHDGQVRYALYGDDWVPGYLSAWNPDRKADGALEGLLSKQPPDKDGDIPYGSLLGSGVRAYWRKLPDFDLLSPSKLILSDVSPQLKLVDAPRPHVAALEVEMAELGDTAGLVGAAALARDGVSIL